MVIFSEFESPFVDKNYLAGVLVTWTKFIWGDKSRKPNSSREL